jgi:subtilisin family serine protease
LVTCKNPAGPDEDQQPYITVRNSCGIALDIYMDGTFQFYLENNEYYYIENVIPGTHLLEAKKKDTNILVKSQTAEIQENYGYTWTISSNAALKITNNYGETLDIYGDGTFQSALPDQTDLLLGSISYGEHTVEAKKQGGTTVVASTTIEVIEDITYEWIIQK